MTAVLLLKAKLDLDAKTGHPRFVPVVRVREGVTQHWSTNKEHRALRYLVRLTLAALQNVVTRATAHVRALAVVIARLDLSHACSVRRKPRVRWRLFSFRRHGRRHFQ